MSGARAATRTDPRVRVAQVELLLDGLPSTVGGTLAGAVLTVGFLVWTTPFDVPALAWLGGAALVALARALHGRRLRRSATTPANVESRIVALTVLATTNASLWGALGWAAGGTADPMVLLVVVMMLAGLAASGIAFLSRLRPMFVLFLGATMLPVAARLALLDSDGLRWLAPLIVAYLVVLGVASRATARATLHSLALRFENAELVERLAGEVRRADEARAEAERANRAKSAFLAAASHDMKQPLQALRLRAGALGTRVGAGGARGAGGWAADPHARGEDELALVAGIDDSVRALDALFESILDASELDAGTLRARVRDVALDDVLERVRRTFEPLGRAAGLAFAVAPSGAAVRTDPDLLERLLANLVANAVRYTPEGGVRIRALAPSGAGPGARVSVRVSDTGVGIDPGEHERVFEEFVQLGNRERDRRRGIGPGLSIVRRLACLLDVELELDSAPGRGTRVTLGIEAGTPSRVDADGSPPLAAESRPAFDDLLVLVVDDERDVAEATRALLESWSATCAVAGSGAEALERLDELGRVPDVIVSDYRLRGRETGPDAVAAVRERLGTAVPALLVTGDVAPERLARIHASGLPVLHEPSPPDELARRLRALADEGVGAGPIDVPGAASGAASQSPAPGASS